MKILQGAYHQIESLTVIVTFGAIIDTWNISINIHIMDINNIGCIPPNKIPQTTIATFGAIIDTWNISIYIHIMDKKYYSKILYQNLGQP